VPDGGGGAGSGSTRRPPVPPLQHGLPIPPSVADLRYLRRLVGQKEAALARYKGRRSPDASTVATLQAAADYALAGLQAAERRRDTGPPWVTRSYPASKRFAPPRDAELLTWSQARNGDWAYSSGYWWRIESLRPSEREGYPRCDLWRPRDEQVSVWVHTQSAFKRGGDNPYAPDKGT